MENENKQENQQGNAGAVSELAQMVERLEKANQEAREILRRQEELAARNLLGGQTNSGVQKPKEKEETPQEYAKRISGGK